MRISTQARFIAFACIAPTQHKKTRARTHNYTHTYPKRGFGASTTHAHTRRQRRTQRESEMKRLSAHGLLVKVPDFRKLDWQYHKATRIRAQQDFIVVVGNTTHIHAEKTV